MQERSLTRSSNSFCPDWTLEFVINLAYVQLFAPRPDDSGDSFERRRPFPFFIDETCLILDDSGYYYDERKELLAQEREREQLVTRP